jgi:hypothetical protein
MVREEKFAIKSLYYNLRKYNAFLAFQLLGCSVGKVVCHQLSL